MKKLSLINPSRNNLQYLKWSYASVRKHASADIEYCVASDYSNDGTVEWCEETAKADPYFKFIVNDGTWFGENTGELKRAGHTILYDKLIEEVATGDIVMIWHSDMYITPGSFERVLELIKPRSVVSMTRIEPVGLHPPGPEKLLLDFGLEPEEFDEIGLLKYAKDRQEEYKNKTTTGVFAPWAIYKEDFLAIGGHDPLFAPQSREDSCIFNRFVLAGYELIQTWEAYVAHLTCRGSRFNPQLTTPGKASAEWVAHNRKSERNFIRKWGHMVQVDPYMKPIIPHKYDIGFIVTNCNYHALEALEPWCSRIYTDLPETDIIIYMANEQSNTMYDLAKRVYYSSNFYEQRGDIIVRFDCRKLTQENFKFITQLPEILESQVTEIASFDYDIFDIRVHAIRHYEKDLIVCDKTVVVR